MAYTYDEQRHTFVLDKYSSVEAGKTALEKIAKRELVISNDEDYDLLYDQRTLLKKETKYVADKRKQMVGAITGKFVAECKEIEKFGSELYEEMTAKLNAYRPPKERKKTSWKLTIKCDDFNTYNKIRNFALNYGVEVSEE